MGPKLLVRLGFVIFGIVFGPLPPGLLGWLGMRAIRRDPTYRGTGRAIFALSVAGFLALACFAGLVGVVVRH